MGKHIGLLAALAVAGCDWNGGYDPYDYEVWDADRDAQLTYGEFERGFGETWGEWDADADGYVSVDEFGTRWDDPGMFDTWDLDDDDLLSRDELGRGIYGTWDADDSGYLTEEEWGFE